MIMALTQSKSLLTALLVGLLLTGSVTAVAQQSEKTASTEKDETTKPDPLPWEIFHPDFVDNDFDGTENRAWEYRPYKVAVWFCLDGSPGLNAIYPALAADVTERSELMDASGWDLTTGLAPSKFRGQLMRFLATPERCTGFADIQALQQYDKLMIVCLEEENSRTRSRVREFDVQTQQWGPISDSVFSSFQAIGGGVTDSIAASFMPLAKIDRVTEVDYQDDKGNRKRRDEVVMQVRAVKSCLKTTLVEAALLPKDVAQEASSGSSATASDAGSEDTRGDDGKFVWIAGPAETAPAFVNKSDRFLPIIRKTDRQGNLDKLEPIEFTFLTIDSIDGPVLRSTIHSSARAPLSQRASKRAQKLALVIRPPEKPTTLRLLARDKETRLEGFEIYSRYPGQKLEEESELLGKTDWLGEISIPPNKDGLRLIYVKRGSRALKKIPIIAGLYDFVQTTLPNDEVRLYAEGVFKGLENEILGLVIEREFAESEVAAAIKSGNVDDARATNDRLKALEKFSDLKIRVSNSASDLKFMTTDQRERQYIDNQLTVLTSILDKRQRQSKEQELLEQVQDLSFKAREKASSEQ